MRILNRIAWGSLLVALLATVGAYAAHAEGLDTWAPRYTAPAPEAPAYTPHSLYGGIVGGGAWTDADELEDGTWQGGLVLGYLYRSGRLGAGVEADYVVQDLEDADIEDGMASVRGRLGVFMDDKTFLYATGGVSEATGELVPDELSKGLVVGGGIERDVGNGRVAVRAELLHYRHTDRHTEWGDEGSTAGRVGLVARF